MDNIRVSMSKDSPMMQALNVCVVHIDDEVLARLVPRLCELIKHGIGLGTKVGFGHEMSNEQGIL